MGVKLMPLSESKGDSGVKGARTAGKSSTLFIGNENLCRQFDDHTDGKRRAYTLSEPSCP